MVFSTGMQLSKCSALQRYWKERARACASEKKHYNLWLQLFLGHDHDKNEFILLRSAVQFSVIIVPRSTSILYSARCYCSIWFVWPYVVLKMYLYAAEAAADTPSYAICFVIIIFSLLQCLCSTKNVLFSFSFCSFFSLGVVVYIFFFISRLSNANIQSNSTL